MLAAHRAAGRLQQERQEVRCAQRRRMRVALHCRQQCPGHPRHAGALARRIGPQAGAAVGAKQRSMRRADVRLKHFWQGHPRMATAAACFRGLRISVRLAGLRQPVQQGACGCSCVHRVYVNSQCDNFCRKLCPAYLAGTSRHRSVS